VFPCPQGGHDDAACQEKAAKPPPILEYTYENSEIYTQRRQDNRLLVVVLVVLLSVVVMVLLSVVVFVLLSVVAFVLLSVVVLLLFPVLLVFAPMAVPVLAWVAAARLVVALSSMRPGCD
jgi:hypothetical protein